MELVYLWIEKYKNIKEQGFNFSLRFTCKYENDIFTIHRKEPKPITVFPENINITAIVGENGSGKSSLFKSILQSIKYPVKPTNPSGTIQPDLHIDGLIPCFLIVEIEEKLYYINNTKKDISFEDCNEIQKNKIGAYSIYVNYMLDSLKDDASETWVDNYYYRHDNYATPILLEPNKKNNQIDLNTIDYLMAQRFDWQFLTGQTHEVIRKFFHPTHVLINADTEKLKSKLKKLRVGIRFKHPIIGALTFKDALLENMTIEKLEVIFEQFVQNSEKQIDEFFNNCNYSAINKLYFVLKILLNEGLTNIPIWRQLVKMILDSNTQQDILMSLITIVDTQGMQTIYNELEDLSELTFSTKDKLRYCVRFQEIENTIQKKNIIANIEIIQKENTTQSKRLLAYPMWITKTYFEGDPTKNGKSLDKLSSGEKTYLKFLMMMAYEIEQIRTKKDDGGNKIYHTMNFFLDEVEFSMHPNWQKRLLKNIVDLLKPIDLDFNIMLASHSPFLLSDIPKENVIFLKDGKQDNPDIPQTFGANIHTLLSHGFFYERGADGRICERKKSIMPLNILIRKNLQRKK
ncbi:AAA family ATPase [Sulfurospirillum diekertiae]|uniref:AAA family ATPase n=1 Tax=Sulfurospirillum diekertiae TaxID=1854492 RepID=UPI000B4CBC96|nr:AAA family ATPase [Sulfurospirillum diekertiae]ASC94017.1 hypothetical protein Sdiek2_2002 [Sulfurospirillum diekertiae]